MAVERALTVIMYPPSPVTHTTGRSRYTSFSATAAGSPQPMPAVPPGQKKVCGCTAWKMCAIHVRLLPASSAYTVSSGIVARSNDTSRCGVTGELSSCMAGSS